MKYLLCVLLVFVFSCNRSNTQQKKILNYIDNYLELSITPDNLYFILPTQETCNSCLIATREFLLNKEGKYKNIHLIYVGNSKKELSFLSEGLSEKYTVIYDTKNAGIKKGAVGHYAVLINVGKTQNVIFEFSMANNWDKMKEQVSTFIKQH